MHNNLYKTTEPKIELDFAKSLIVIVTLMVVFVIPVQIITYYRSQTPAPSVSSTATTNTAANGSQATLKNSTAAGTATTSKVAGASTTKSSVKGVESINIPLINQTIDLNSQTGLLILLGLFLIGISILLTLYLLIDGAREEEHRKHYR